MMYILLGGFEVDPNLSSRHVCFIFHFREADGSGIQLRKLEKFHDYHRSLYLKTLLN